MKKILFLSTFLLAVTAGYSQSAAASSTGENKTHCAPAGQAKCCAHAAGNASCAKPSENGSADKTQSTSSNASGTRAERKQREGKSTAKMDN